MFHLWIEHLVCRGGTNCLLDSSGCKEKKNCFKIGLFTTKMVFFMKHGGNDVTRDPPGRRCAGAGRWPVDPSAWPPGFWRGPGGRPSGGVWWTGSQDAGSSWAPPRHRWSLAHPLALYPHPPGEKQTAGSVSVMFRPTFFVLRF